jgi:hypothetical protein
MKDAPPAVPAAAEQQSSVRSQNSRLGLLVATTAPDDDTADGNQPPGNKPGSVCIQKCKLFEFVADALVQQLVRFFNIF